MKLKDARAHIQSRRLTLDTARHQLGLLRDSAHLLRLFEELFPDEFSAPVEGGHEAAGILGNVPKKLQRFYDMVRERLFPLPDSYFLDEDFEDWLRGVPFWPLLPDSYDIEIDELPTYYKLMLALMDGDFRKAVLTEQLGEARADRFMAAGTRIDSARLRRLCERAGGPLEHFILALDVVTRDTGNDWIDISPEECGAYEFEWSAETLKMLAEEYRKADAILDRVRAFDDWLEEDASHIEMACAIWMRAAGDCDDDDRQMVFMIDGVPLLPDRFEFPVAAAIGA